MEKLLEKNIDEQKQGEVLQLSESKKARRKMYIESYGCQMNFSDSEIVASILTGEGFSTTKDITEDDIQYKIPKVTSKEKINVKVTEKIVFNNKNIPIIAGPNGVESRELIFNVAKFFC